MIRLLRCKNCGKEFEAKRNDAKWCRECQKAHIHEGQSLICPICGGRKKCGESSHCQLCENKLRAKKGDKSWNWKGGKSKTQSGHVVILKPEGYETYKHRYISEHRFIWEQAYGKLPKGYVIHHFNGVKDDNRRENLVALPRNAHSGSVVLNAFKSRILQLEQEIRILKGG